MINGLIELNIFKRFPLFFYKQFQNNNYYNLLNNYQHLIHLFYL